MNRRHVGLIGACIGLLSFVACHNAASPTPTDTPSTPTTATPTVTITGTATFTDVGQTAQLTATATAADGTQQDVTDQAAWQSSGPEVVTVSATGLVTSVALGRAAITATFQGVVGTATASLPLNLTHSWAGTGLDSTGASQFAMDLTQAGTTVSGPVTFTRGGVSFSGRLTGNVSQFSPRVPFVISGSGSVGSQTCTMAISGNAQASNSAFAASYSGNNSCVGPISNGQLTLAVQ